MTTLTITNTPANTWLVAFCDHHQLLYEFTDERNVSTWRRTIRSRDRTLKIGIVEYRLSGDQQSWIPANASADLLTVGSPIPASARLK